MLVRCNRKNYNSIVICLRHAVSLTSHSSLISPLFSSHPRHPNFISVSQTSSSSTLSCLPQPRHRFHQARTILMSHTVVCASPTSSSAQVVPSSLLGLTVVLAPPWPGPSSAKPFHLLRLCRSIVCYLNVDHFHLCLTSLDHVITPTALFHRCGSHISVSITLMSSLVDYSNSCYFICLL
jgi:hypothetical protein